jgi:hypothetical protein
MSCRTYVLVGLTCQLIFLFSCTHKGKVTQASAFHSTILARLGNETEVDWNKIKTIAIVRQQTADQTHPFRYLIITQEGRILNEGQIKPGYIKWLTDNTVEYLDLPGIIRENETLEKYKKTLTFQ